MLVTQQVYQKQIDSYKIPMSKYYGLTFLY